MLLPFACNESRVSAKPCCRHPAAQHKRPNYACAGEVHGCSLHVLRSAHDGAVSCSCVDASCMCQLALQLAWHSPCSDGAACWHHRSVHESASRSAHLLNGALDAIHVDGPRVEVLWGAAVEGGADVDLVPAVRLHALPRLHAQRSSPSLAEGYHTRQN